MDMIYCTLLQRVLTFHFTRSDSGLVASTDTSIGGPLGAVSIEKITLLDSEMLSVYLKISSLQFSSPSCNVRARVGSLGGPAPTSFTASSLNLYDVAGLKVPNLAL
jgi:hypothetical protein